MISDNAVNAYVTFLALKLHFESNTYDYFQYGGKLKLKNPRETLKKRKDLIFFELLGKKENFKEFLIYSFVTFDNVFVRDLIKNEKYQINYEKMKSEYQNIIETFEKDISKIDNVKDLVKNNGFYPRFLKMIINGDISIFTPVILNKIFKWSDKVDKYIEDEFLWPKWKKRVDKFDNFVYIHDQDMKKVSSIFKKQFS